MVCRQPLGRVGEVVVDLGHARSMVAERGAAPRKGRIYVTVV